MKYIYLHGLGQTPDSWNAILNELHSPEAVLCPNLAELIPGGNADYSSLYTAFSDLCAHTDEELVLCGLSLGSVLALNYAIDHPERVKALVLIAPQYKMPRTLLKLQNLLFHFMPKSAFAQTGFQKADFIRLCRSMAELDFSRSLHKITCPTLILCGENDRANQKAARMLARLLKNATFQQIPNAGHEVNTDAPERLAEILKKWKDAGNSFCFFVIENHGKPDCSNNDSDK